VLLSTLPEIAGQAFEVRGFVYAQATLGAIGGGNTRKMVQSLTDQAQQLGADAVVDLRTALGGDPSAHCVMTGTTVRLIPPA
jgi:hypothetical protein